MKKKQKNIDDVLLLRIIENRADDSEKGLFTEWHDRSPENADLFAQMKKAYELSTFDKHSTQTNWKKVVDKVGTSYNVPDFIELPEPRKVVQIIRLNALLRVAAAIVLIVGISFLMKNIVFSPEQLVVSGMDLKNNEPYCLADGSLVYLHGNSEISFAKNFGAKNRKVNLKGEAFFEIKSNKNLPFVIASNNTKTKVVGTSFNVFSDTSGEVRVSVVTGVVEFFANKKNIVELSAGEQGTFNPVTKRINKASSNNPNFQSWKTGIIFFRDTPLEEAFDLLSQHYLKVLIFNSTKNKIPTITTTFDNQPFEAVLEELNLLLNTENVLKNDTIIFEQVN